MKLKRETYLEQIRPYYDSDIIKVITGVRRCGKSILLDTIREELIENGIKEDHIIYINFEDLDFDYIVDASDLNKEIKSRITDNDKYPIILSKKDTPKSIKESDKVLKLVKNTHTNRYN